jgi:transposase
LVVTRDLAAHVRAHGRGGASARRALPRQHPREGPPLGPDHKRGAWPEAVGISRGGATSKIHALADAQGRPVALALTPGNTADIHMAIPLLEGLPRPKRLLADKAYDAMSLRRRLKRRKIRAVIPSLATRTFPFPLDRKAYKRRNVIERLWSRLKTWRRIATRYDRLARNYLASLALVSVMTAWA